MSFGKNLLKERLKRGYSKEFLAVNIGATSAGINSWETEARTPPLNKVKQIAEFLGITIDELVGTTPENGEQIRNIANIRLCPGDQSSIERIKRMREAGLTEEQIDKAIEFAILMISQKK